MEIDIVWCCRKCGVSYPYAFLRKHPTVRCPSCQEPDIDLYGICGLLDIWKGEGKEPEEGA